MTDFGNASAGRDLAIWVENLSFQYPVGEQPALQEINFAVKRGEFIGIMGPSGAGKTTLSMILKGLIPYSVAGRISGRVEIFGQEVTMASVKETTRQVGFVFQDPEMQIIGLTVEEDLAFGPENYQWESSRIRAKISEILKLVRMERYETRETWSLSGGQKQRVAIASALILEPDILILDEPTSELDPIGKAEVFETIRHLREESNITVLMVEHEIEELAEMADRIFLFNEGCLIDSGTPLELFRKTDLFHQIGGERVPQVSEVLSSLHQQDLLDYGQFAVSEQAGVDILKKVLEKHV